MTGQNETVELTSSKAVTVTFDDILRIIGEFGRHQKVLYFLFSVPYVITSMQLLGWVFVGADLKHRCRLEHEVGWGENVTFVGNQSSCSMPKSDENCLYGHVYDTSIIGDSVVKDWDLVCDKRGLRATIGAAPMVGYLLGGFILGGLSDKLGRKPVFIISDVLLLISGLVTAVAPEFYSFTAARTVVGFGLAGLESSAFIMGMELVGPSKRTLAGLLCWFFETSGLLLTLVLATVIPNNWRLLQAMYSLPFVLFLSYWFIAPESIRWLMTQGRNKEARKLIEKTAEVNKVDLRPSLLDQMEETLERELQEEANLAKTYTVLDLFRFFHMRIKTMVLMVAWIVCASLYYVLLLDQSELSDNPYIGYFITCAVQIPGYFYVIFTLERPAFGRKKSLAAFLILSGLMLCMHPLVPKELNWLRMGLSIFGRFCANCSYTILHLFAAEQYPTVVRGIGMGFSYVVSRFGSILAPFVLLVGHWAPVVFGVGALIAGILTTLLPETLGKSLPDSLADGEKLPIVWPWKI